MGFQSQEQKIFEGLFTTGDGATRPRFSASDEVNVDHQHGTVRGREPSHRVHTQELPQLGYHCDGSTSLVELSSIPTAGVAGTAWACRLYVGHVDAARLSSAAVATRHCLLNTSGNGTLAIGTPASGFNLYLEVNASTNLDLICKFYDGAIVNTLTIANVGTPTAAFGSIDNYRCIQLQRTSSGDYSMKIYSDATTVEATSGVVNTTTLDTTGMGTWLIGAYSDAGQSVYEQYAPCITGGIALHTTDTPTSPPFTALSRADFPADLEWCWFPDYEGHQKDVMATSSGSRLENVTLHPIPTGLVTDHLEIDLGSWAELDMRSVNQKLVQSWMQIVDFQIPAQTLDSSSPPWLLADSNYTISVHPSTATQYTITVSVGLFDINGVASATASVSTLGLNFTDRVRLAVVVERNMQTPRTSTLAVYQKVGAGAWALTGTSGAQVGTPDVGNRIFFCSNVDEQRFLEAHLYAFRFFSGFSTPPANATDVGNLDVYPTDGSVTQWPDNLIASFDASSGEVGQVVLNAPKVRDLATFWRDDYSQRYVIEMGPENPRSRWSCFPGMSMGTRPPVYAAAPSVELRGGSNKRVLNYLLPGGIWRFDEETLTGAWLQHPDFQGTPTGGVDVVTQRDRQIMTGPGFRGLKIFPGGVGHVGLPAPAITATTALSASTGGLTATTSYKWRVTLYSSRTGQESNANETPITATTGAADDTVTMTFTYVIVPPAYEDWDTLRIYRFAGGAGLNQYYLDQEIPRPKKLPPEGATFSATLGLAEDELVIQSPLEYDNDPPSTFTVAGMSSRVAHVGSKGRVFYSKPLFIESFPPLNLFRLDDDQSNPVMAVVFLFGRAVILKRRGVWGGPENFGELGTPPALLHSDRGLVSQRAWAVADNRLVFMSPDRCVYVTDGLEIQDVSSVMIKDTMFSYGDAQLEDVQAVHDARSKAVWFLMPPGSGDQGAAREVLVYSYMRQRWQKYEMPCDSLNTGRDSASGGYYAGFGYRGAFYRLRAGDTNQESDAGSGQVTFEHDYDDQAVGESLLLDSSNHLTGVRSDTFTWDSSVVGMPCIVVPHSATYDPAAPSSYHPLWNGEARIYTYVKGVRADAGSTSLLFGEHFTVSTRYVWVGVGLQFRRYLSQWIAPQGEDRPHMLYGGTFVHAPGQSTSTTDVRFRYYVDYETGATSWRTVSANPRFPDTSHEVRRRCRRFAYEMAQSTRGKLFEITRVTWRYRVRGPRRKR
ncbi:MAG: hypothetical protein ACE5EF_00130 [Dehalococcoidia bacterium]